MPTGVANPVNNPRVPLWGERQGEAARGRPQGAGGKGQGKVVKVDLQVVNFTVKFTLLWVEESGA